MIGPLLQFRNYLTEDYREILDSARILTSVIRGSAQSLTIPASIPILPGVRETRPSMLTLISRVSSRRAGTRFNSRGINDDGNVSNFVETETLLWTPVGVTFSYTQVRGSVPVFWEQSTGNLPTQQKIQITRSQPATQPAFDKHFENLQLNYGAVHVVNLLSETKPAERQLSDLYSFHIGQSPLRKARHDLLRETRFDFHAETRNSLEAAWVIRDEIAETADVFAYFLLDSDRNSSRVVLQQEGVFRTNCLDCLDRTNLTQTVISQMALELFFAQQGTHISRDFWRIHSTLWADNGDILSKSYAGTGALKSSFTRNGKMSWAGALSDATKTAARFMINNFSDKARQKTIDCLLGSLSGQHPVELFDPVNDAAMAEVRRRAAEYSFYEKIRIWVGTYNLNGKSHGARQDLSPWLLAHLDEKEEEPGIVAVAFQEIVNLNPQQIMSTDPANRRIWEDAVIRTLNERAKQRGTANYVLLRSEQLVGAALLLFVKEDLLKYIKNVEGSDKKTGMSGMAGNKGGCAIRLELSSTHLCFVTAHLAAGFANYDERNDDFHTISYGMRFQRNRTIKDHDSILWFGDFNYRIGMRNEDVRVLVKRGDLASLYQHDQLSIQMMAGIAFRFYSEGPITFPPTYKYDIGTDTYDTSEKARVPAWCDRVLYMGSNLQLLQYNAAPLKFSDHRPVYATFECTIKVVDEEAKERIRKEAVNRQKSTLEYTKHEKEDSEDLLDYDPIAPDLPPASTDRRKWWLDQKHPSRSEINIPDYPTLNPTINPNPFKQENRPSMSSNPPSTMSGSSSSDLATLNSVMTAPPTERTPASGRKQPPPIPRKPPSMRSISQGLNNQPLQSRPQQSPLPLRTASTRVPSAGQMPPLGLRKTNTMPPVKTHNAPPVPRQATGLLDDDTEPTLSWKPLQPR